MEKHYLPVFYSDLNVPGDSGTICLLKSLTDIFFIR